MSQGDSAQGQDPVLAAFQQALAQAASQGGSGSSGAVDPQLFMGMTTGRVGPTMKLGVIDGENITGPNLGNMPNITTQSQAEQLWYEWSPQQQMAWTKKSYALGYLKSPVDVQGAQQLWMNAVKESTLYFKSGRHISPWQVLDRYAGSNSDVLKQRAQVGPNGSITHTNSQINLSDKASVEALATQVLQQALGRDPTQSEINTYYNTIRGQERSHPTVQTTTTDATGNTTSTVNGGFTESDAATMLQSQIQNDPEFAKYQGGTKYYGAALQALGAIGGA